MRSQNLIRYHWLSSEYAWEFQNNAFWDIHFYNSVVITVSLWHVMSATNVAILLKKKLFTIAETAPNVKNILVEMGIVAIKFF